MIKEAASEVRNWFKNNLEIIDPDDYVLDVTDSTNLDKLSEIVSGFDVGIKTIDWKRVDDQEEIDEVIRSSSTRDKSVIKEVLTSKTDGNIQTSCTVKLGKNIYQFISGKFGFVLNKLVTYHENGKCHSISEESDGTRRLIELSSILLPTNIHKTYLVDELDCRIHPLLVEHFIDLYFKDRFGSSDRKQLIFTTHEIGLLSTKMFRTDEIWFVDKDKNGCSNFHSAYEGSISYNAKLSDLYLTEQTLGGVPKFRNL